MRIQPTRSTLKKLFALSGNMCAFPGCTQSIVDINGNLIGQICHIEAAEKGGERYNVKQTDQERASFKNLILFCANHHIETNDVKKYTVDVLKEIKKKHEAQHIGNKYKVSDEVLRQVERLFDQTNTNSGSGQQNNYQANSIVIKNTNGVTASDVVSIVQNLFEANFPVLVEKASQKAVENVAKFKQEISKQIGTTLTPADLDKFSEPDVQFVLNEATTAAARNDSEELRKTLSKLVVNRVKENDVDIKRLVLNGAISTAGKLTLNQMKIITLCFMTKNTRFMEVRTFDALKKHFDSKIKPFIDIRGTSSELLYLQYAGCGNVQSFFSNDIIEHFRNTYGAVFINSFTDGEVKGLGLPEELSRELFIKVDGRNIPNVDGEGQLKEVLTAKNIDTPLINNAVAVYNSKLPRVEEVKIKFETEIDWTKQFFETYKDAVGNLFLTSVGMAIALAFFEQQIGQPLNMETWIN